MKKNLQIMRIVPAQIKVVNQVAQDPEIFLTIFDRFKRVFAEATFYRAKKNISPKKYY